MAKGDFETVLKLKDEVFGLVNERRFTGDDPYDLLWGIFCTPGMCSAINGRKRVRITHRPTGKSLRAMVDFDGADEHGFSAPVADNEAAIDAWVEKCAAETFSSRLGA